MPVIGMSSKDSQDAPPLPFGPEGDDFARRGDLQEEEDDDDGLDERYRVLALKLLGETPERREEALTGLRRRLAEEETGLVVPTSKAFLLKFIRAGE